MDQEKIEQNIVNSFNLAKKDINSLYEHVKVLHQSVEELQKENSFLYLQIKNMTKKKVKVQKNKKYISSKTGKKLHQANCLHARNIKKTNRVIFNNKTEALNQNYKLCSCLAY
jgi:regulator of replication initiation timing